MSGVTLAKGALALFFFVGTAFAQAQHDPAAVIAAQVEAMRVFASIFEMELKRIGDTGWPAENSVPPK